MADDKERSIQVTLTNSALTVFTIRSATMTGTGWIENAGALWSSAPSTPGPGGEVGIFAYVTWGVRAKPNAPGPAAEIVLDGPGDPITLRFAHTSPGAPTCTCDSTGDFHVVVQQNKWGEVEKARFSVTLTRQI